MRSGDAIPIWIWSKVSGLASGFAKLVSSFISFSSWEDKSLGDEGRAPPGGSARSRYSAASARPSPSSASSSALSSTLRPSERSEERRVGKEWRCRCERDGAEGQGE